MGRAIQQPRETLDPARSWAWVLLGLFSSGLLAWLSHARPTWTVALGVVPAAGMLFAWWRLRPGLRHPIVVAVLWSAPLFLALPLWSGDVWAYIAQGWMVSAGLDPYATTLSQAQVPGVVIGGHWAETTSVYPPGSLLIFGAAWQLGGSAGGALLVLRLIHLACVVILGWAVARIARRIGVDPLLAMWAGLNPLLILHFIGGVHNDAMLVAVIALAALAATRGGWQGMLLGGALVGAAMLVKQSGAAAGLGVVAVAWAAFPGRSWAQLLGRACGAGAMAVAVFVGGSLASGYGFGWHASTAGNPLMAMSNSPWSWLAQAMAVLMPAGFALTVRVLTVLSGALVVAALAWSVVRWGPRPGVTTGQPWAVLTVGLLAFAVLGPGLQPWYLTWAAPFVMLAQPSQTAQRAALLVLIVATIQLPLQIVIGVIVATAIVGASAWIAWQRHRTMV